MLVSAGQSAVTHIITQRLNCKGASSAQWPGNTNRRTVRRFCWRKTSAIICLITYFSKCPSTEVTLFILLILAVNDIRCRDLGNDMTTSGAWLRIESWRADGLQQFTVHRFVFPGHCALWAPLEYNLCMIMCVTALCPTLTNMLDRVSQLNADKS